MVLFKVENLSLEYTKGKKIIKNINFEIEEGQFISIIGPNASGKSTIIKALAKILLPLKGGKIFYKNKEINLYKSKEYSKNIAYVPQIVDFPNDITIYDFVSMGRYPHNSFLFSNDKKNKIIVNDSLKKVNLLNMADSYLNELSGGQRQRVLIALALAQDTQTILLDEPTNHLDIKHQLEIIHLLHDLNHKYKKTIILVIHDINHGIKFADKVLVVNNGEVVHFDIPENIVSEENIKKVFGVSAKIILSDNKKIISDYWIDDLKSLSSYND